MLWVPTMLWELANVIERSLSIIFKRLWQSKAVPDVWSKANITLLFHKGKEADLRNNRVGILTRFQEREEQNFLEAMSEHINNQKLSSNNIYRFTKGNSCLTNPRRTRLSACRCDHITTYSKLEQLKPLWVNGQCSYKAASALDFLAMQ